MSNLSAKTTIDATIRTPIISRQRDIKKQYVCDTPLEEKVRRTRVIQAQTVLFGIFCASIGNK